MLWHRLISVYEIVIRNFFHFEKLEIFHFKACLPVENLKLEADPFSEYRTRPSDVLACIHSTQCRACYGNRQALH